MDRRRAAGVLLALAACVAYATAAPTASNHTSLDLYDGAPDGCYYNFQHYGEGDRIMTNEPCLNCTCHNRMLMCYLRVCPFTKPIGQDCTIEKRADQCCPIVTCPDVPVDLLTSTTTSPAEYGASGLGKLDKYGCSIHGKYFSEGSKVPPTPNKPCEHCYCIRNMTTCVMQECTLHVDGCTPIYHKDVCCPVRYSCDHPEDEMPLLDDLSTTVRPTPGFVLTTTTLSPVTQMSQECLYENKIIPDGALIKTEKACDHCYCMKGDIVCVVQECGTPMENEGKNCTALPPREGVCCPDTYICEGDESTTGTYEGQYFTTELYQEKLTTQTPPRRAGSEGSGYRIEPDDIHNTESPYVSETEGSGDEQATVHPTVVSEIYPDSHKMEPTTETVSSTEEAHEFIPIISTVEPSSEYDELTTVKEEKQSAPGEHVTSSLNDSIPKEGESTTSKAFDEDIGSGEEEISAPQEIVPTSSVLPAIEDSEPTVANKQDIATTESGTEDYFVKEGTTNAPIVEKENKVSSPNDQNSATDISVETTTQSRRYLDEEDGTKKPSIFDEEAFKTERDSLQTTTIVPVDESDKRKSTEEVEQESTTLYETDSKETLFTESTSVPVFEDEIVTESQDIMTDGIEDSEGSTSTDIDLNHHNTLTASTPLLEEIEKETTEQENVPHDNHSDDYTTSTTQSNIPIETIDKNDLKPDSIDETISTNIPNTVSKLENDNIPTTESQKDHDKDKKESSEPQDQSFTSHLEDEIIKTTQSDIVEESSDSQEYTPITTHSPYEEEIKKTTEIDSLINNVSEGQTDDDIHHTDLSIATTLQQNEITTAEPDKGLNTIPSGAMDDETTESPEQDKITPADDKLISLELTTELENKFNDNIDTVADTSTHTTLVKETSRPSEDQFVLTTESAKKEIDDSKSTTVHEITEPTTRSADIAESTVAHDHSSSTEAALSHQESDSPAVTETIDNIKQITDSTEPSFTTSFESITEATSDADSTPSKQETLSYETISESTTANLEENEIVNEPRIPGEGDCLLNGVTYRNESIVPNTNKCQSGCRCVSSIIKCDPIICSPPPKYMDNCHATYDSPNSCCPTYVCDHKTETMPPQSHSQVSGTEAPEMPPFKCQGDECVINEDKTPSIEITELCESGKCPSHGETDYSLPPHIPQQPVVDKHKECTGEKCTPITDQMCDGEKGCQAAPVKPCEGNECRIISDSIPPHQLQPCADGENCEVPVKECNGEDCSSGTDIIDKKPHDKICDSNEDCETKHDIEKECTEKSCKRKGDSGVNQHEPSICSGSECQSTEITSELELTTVSTALSQKESDLESDIKTTDNIDIMTENPTKLPSQDQSTKLIENATEEPEQDEIVHSDADSKIKPEYSTTTSSEITTKLPELETVNESATASEETANTDASPLPHLPESNNLDEENYETEPPTHLTSIHVTDKQGDIVTSDLSYNNEQTTEKPGEFITIPPGSLEQQEVTKPIHEQTGPIKTHDIKLPEEEIIEDATSISEEMFTESPKTPYTVTSEAFKPTENEELEDSTSKIFDTMSTLPSGHLSTEPQDMTPAPIGYNQNEGVTSMLPQGTDSNKSPTERTDAETSKPVGTDLQGITPKESESGITEIVTKSEDIDVQEVTKSPQEISSEEKQEEQQTESSESHNTEYTESSDVAVTTTKEIADKSVTESSQPSETSQDVTLSQQEIEKDVTTSKTVVETDAPSYKPDAVGPLESSKSPVDLESDLHLFEKNTTPQSADINDIVTEQYSPTVNPLEIATKQVEHIDVTASSDMDEHISAVIPDIQNIEIPSTTEEQGNTKTEVPFLHETKGDTTYVSSTLKPSDITDVSYSVDKATEYLETTAPPGEESTETLDTTKQPSEEHHFFPEKTSIPVSISTEKPYAESETKLPIHSDTSNTDGPATDKHEFSPTEPADTYIDKTETPEYENKFTNNLPERQTEIPDRDNLSITVPEDEVNISEKPIQEAHDHPVDNQQEFEAPVSDNLMTTIPEDIVKISEKPTNVAQEPEAPARDNLSTEAPEDEYKVTHKPADEAQEPEAPGSNNLSTGAPEDVDEITEKPAEKFQESEESVSDNESTKAPIDEVKFTERPAEDMQESGTPVSDHLNTINPEDNVEITEKPADDLQEPEVPVSDNLSTMAPLHEVEATEKTAEGVQEPEAPGSDYLSTTAPADEVKLTKKPAEEVQESEVPVSDNLSTTAPVDENEITEKPAEEVQGLEGPVSDNLSTTAPVDENEITEKPAEEMHEPEAPASDHLSTAAPEDNVEKTEKPSDEKREPEAPVSIDLSTTAPVDEVDITDKPTDKVQEPEASVDEVKLTEKPEEKLEASVSNNRTPAAPEDNVEITEKPADEVQEPEAPVSDNLSTAVPVDEVDITEKPTDKVQEPEAPISDHLSTINPQENVEITEKPADQPQEPEVPVSDNLSTIAPLHEVEATEKTVEEVQEPEAPISDHLSTTAPADEVKRTEKPAEEVQQSEVPVSVNLSTMAPLHEVEITEKPTEEMQELEAPINDHLSTIVPDDGNITQNPEVITKETETEPTINDKIEIETSTRRDGTGDIRTEIPDFVNQEFGTKYQTSTDIPKLVTQTYIEEKATTESPAVTKSETYEPVTYSEEQFTIDSEIKSPVQGDLTLQPTTTESVQDFTKTQNLEGHEEGEEITKVSDKISTISSVFKTTVAIETIETSTKPAETITSQPDEDIESTPEQNKVETTTNAKIEDELSLIDRESTKTPFSFTDQQTVDGVTENQTIDTATSKQETATQSSEEDLPSRTYRPESSETTAEDLSEKPTDASVLEEQAAVSPVESTSIEPHVLDEELHTTSAADKISTPKIPAVEVQTEKVITPTEYQPESSSETSTPKEKTTMKFTTKAEEVTTLSPLIDRFTKPAPKPTEVPVTEQPRPIPTEEHPTDDIPNIDDEASVPPSGSSGYGQETDYVDEDPTFGPGTCRYGGKVYVSAQQIPRDDPCDFCFCFRSDIICLQQSCPPPIQGCHEEPIQGFCCPRYECPVSMATTVNVTTTTTTTTTTLPPHFPIHSYKGSAQKRGCLIKGHTYKVGEVVRASSGPCLHCTCGGDGQMKCDPKQCTPEPMLRQMIAAAVSAKRRR